MKEILNRIENVLGVRSEVLEEGSPKFHCGCSIEKIKDVVVSMGKDEANSILKEKGSIEFTCEFCKKVYSLNSDEVNLLF
ncbi:MAG: Hsp33 family molecular chaperone HslO [Leptospiraceae bacterium]|nr:Hsp33 family molecular chaperone HslO [Leptospiraceae bacterium]